MSTSITSAVSDGQRKHIKRLSEDAIDAWIAESGADKDKIQRIVAGGGDFQAAIKEKLTELARGRYADEVVPSSYTYPPEFKGLMRIRDQVEALMRHFPHLDPTWALEQGQQWYDRLKPELPDWIEGPLVYVWREASYQSALQIVLDKLAKSRKFQNYREGQLDPKHLKQCELTEAVENKLHAIQPGGFLIVPSQLGKRYAGSSVRRARELFVPGEFGHSSVAVGCLALTHAQRFVRWEQLHADCAGDEFSPDADGVFYRAPCLYFDGGELEFGADDVGYPRDYYGSVSAFLPQSLQLAT